MAASSGRSVSGNGRDPEATMSGRYMASTSNAEGATERIRACARGHGFVEGPFEAADCEGASASDGCHEVGDGSGLKHISIDSRRRSRSDAGGRGGRGLRIINSGNSGDERWVGRHAGVTVEVVVGRGGRETVCGIDASERGRGAGGGRFGGGRR